MDEKLRNTLLFLGVGAVVLAFAWHYTPWWDNTRRILLLFFCSLWALVLLVYALPLYLELRKVRIGLKLQRLAEKGQLLEANTNLSVQSTRSVFQPQTATLEEQIRQMVLQTALAEGLPAAAMELYKTDRMTKLLDVEIRRQIMRMELDAERDRMNMGLSKDRRGGKMKIDLLEVAAKVKRELDGYIRKDDTGAEP
jgi:hypothetical protein